MIPTRESSEGDHVLDWMHTRKSTRPQKITIGIPTRADRAVTAQKAKNNFPERWQVEEKRVFPLVFLFFLLPLLLPRTPLITLLSIISFNHPFTKKEF
jgi:hypothetical protein